ncbi:uncharacterized protein LOC135328147 [Dromaius novaehollandiae]|uniref:uncharacterized protein LOC135328147 n=1 Tax=Dromaius novaehollandiae TaxID=8790 RepID=UPI00311EAE91
MNEKHHSIACHFPRCQGAPVEREEEGPGGPSGFMCEECNREFKTKSGLSQHKRLVHPLLRNKERIEASRPKGKEIRGMHKSCWTEEETVLLIELEKKYKNERFVNKLIGEHLPTKTAKQISDKRRQLAAGAKTSASPRKAEHRREGDEPVEKERIEVIKTEYRKITAERIRAGTLSPSLKIAFEEVLEGTKDTQKVIKGSTEEWLAQLAGHAVVAKLKQLRKHQAGPVPKRVERKWMKIRAVKRGQYLRYQRLFEMDRKKLAGIILDNIEALKCPLPMDELYNSFRKKWEEGGPFQSGCVPQCGGSE